MPTETGHEPEVHHTHKHPLMMRFEGATDLLTVAIIIVLGLAMLIGLLTADGNTTWM